MSECSDIINVDDNKEQQYKLYPSLDGNDYNEDNNTSIRGDNKKKSFVKVNHQERKSSINDSRLPTRKLSKSPTEREYMDFFYEIAKSDCRIPKSEIVLTVSKYLKNTKLIKKLSGDFKNEKKYSISTLCIICAKRLSYELCNKGDVLFKIGEIVDTLYFVLIGKLSVLKLTEVNDCLMTYQEYFEHLWYLHEQKEEYILNETLTKNYNIVQLNNFSHFIDVYKIYFSIIINDKLLSTTCYDVNEIKRLFNMFHFSFEDFNIEEKTVRIGLYKRNQKTATTDNELSTYITSKIKETVNESIDLEQYKYLLSFDIKKPFTLFKYNTSTYFTSGDYFGDFALDSTERKHTATVRCESECILATLSVIEYLRMISPKSKDDKQRIIAFLYENYFFKEINMHIFEKNYLNWFVLMNYKRNYILYEEGNRPDDLYFLKEGTIQIEITSSVIDLHNLVGFLFEQVLTCDHYLDMPVNVRQLLPRSKLEELKKYTSDPEIAKLKSQNENFVLEMLKVKTFELSITSGNIALGIEEMFFDLPYLNSVKVVSQSASLFKIERNKLNSIIKGEKSCLNSFVKIALNKMVSLLERLNHIKRNSIEFALHNAKLDEEQEKRNCNIIVYNESNKVNIKPKVNHSKIEKILNKSPKEYCCSNNSYSSRSNSCYRSSSVTSMPRINNKHTSRTLSTSTESKPKINHSRSRQSDIVDKSNSLFKMSYQTSNKTLDVNNSKMITSFKKEVTDDNNNNDKLLINIRDKYMSLSNLEKELLHFNIRKITNSTSQGNSLLSALTNSENTALSNETDLAITPSIKYKDQVLHNLLLQIGSTKHKSYHKLAQSFRLNYIPLNLDKCNNIMEEEEKKRDRGVQIENLQFISQLKKYKKKYMGSSSVEPYQSVKVIDSNKIPEQKKKEKEKTTPNMLLPNIVRDFYKKIQAKGYSGLVAEHHTYLKRKSSYDKEKEKESIDKKIMKLSGVFATEMNQLKDQMMGKGTSFYFSNRQSSNA